MSTRDLFDRAPERPETVDDAELAAMVRGDHGLAGRLRAVRIGAGLTVGAMGIAHIKAYESAQIRPTPEVVRQIAARAGGDLVALLRAWDEEMPEDSRMRLTEGRAMVDAAIRVTDGGGSCPCCGQAVKAREVALSARLGAVVRGIVRGYRGGPVTLDAGAGLARDAALWDLALPVTDVAFLPTAQAKVFMAGDLRLPRRLIVWQGKIIGQAGKPASWADLKVPDVGGPDVGGPEALALAL